MGRSVRPAARHEQLPGVHWAVVSGALRAACVLGIGDDPVAIKLVEQEIADHAIEAGFGLTRARPSCPPAGRSR